MDKKSYIVLTEKKWHRGLFVNLAEKFPCHSWHFINKKENFTYEQLININPDKLFIPHWSYIIPKQIFINFECVVFHMTDLPYGRGGSPLQNLIVRGHHETKISALKVDEGIDTGPIYLKKNLSLEGTAQEIFERASLVIESMIIEIISKDLKPKEQKGEPVTFKRRKPEDGCISELDNLEKVYDYIRMLDCEGYPPAFLESKNHKYQFSNATKVDNEILANVRITKK